MYELMIFSYSPVYKFVYLYYIYNLRISIIEIFLIGFNFLQLERKCYLVNLVSIQVVPIILYLVTFVKLCKEDTIIMDVK